MRTVNIHEAKTQLTRLVDEAARGSGIFVEAGATGTILNANGVGAVYNAQRGVRLAAGPDNVGSFGPSGAYVNNQNTGGGCDVENTSTTAVTLGNSQWTNNSPRTCGSGTVTVPTVQNPVTVAIPDEIAVEPTNVILTGQTVRLLGAGFNAVAGNAVLDGCVIGDNPTTNACCVKGPRLANTCAGTGNPPAGGGQCVEIRNRYGEWFPMTVSALNPSMVVTAIPQIGSGTLLQCTGDSLEGDALIRVVKKVGGGQDAGVARFCSNAQPIQH